MKEIWNILDELDDRMDNNNIFILDSNTINANEKDFIQNFISKCLNEVRFLIKSSEYSFEKEVRMLHCSHEPKIDVEFCCATTLCRSKPRYSNQRNKTWL